MRRFYPKLCGLQEFLIRLEIPFYISNGEIVVDQDELIIIEIEEWIQEEYGKFVDDDEFETITLDELIESEDFEELK